jgi:hypothetical protein
MKVSNFWLARKICLCLVMLLVVPIGEAATAPQQREHRAAGIAVATGSRSLRGDNNSLAEYSASASYADNPGGIWAQTTDQSQQTAAPQNSQTKQEDSTPVPVGTAAAPYEKSGVPASQPAGAAIAPAKQRRIHSFAIRIALVVGAAVAVGVVAAASLSSSSRPH